jgi:hypothetical protein
MSPAGFLVPLVALSIHASVVVAPPGRTVPVETKYRTPAVSLFIENNAIVEGILGPNGEFSVRGKAPGVTRVTLDGLRDVKWHVWVIVPK